MREDNSRPPLLARRSYLKLVSGTVAAGAFATNAAASGIDYDEVIDVTDVGADPTGNESINDVLERYADHHTLLKFPHGRYLMDRQFRFTGFRDFGIVGDGAVLVPSSDFDGGRMFKLGTYYDPGNGLQFEGFNVDFTAPDTGLRVIQAQMYDRLTVNDIEVAGQHDSGKWGPFLFDITSANGSGTVSNVRALYGGEFSVNTPGDIDTGPTGIIVSPYHDGTLRFENCALGPFPDNGLYASCPGRVVVENGYFRNSNISNIRLTGDDSVVRDTTVVVDDNRPEDENQRGIRLDSGSNLWLDNVDIRLDDPNGHGITVMNDVISAKIEYTDVTVGTGRIHGHGIVVESGAGATDIVDSSVTIDSEGNAIQIKPSGGQVRCIRVNVTGDADGSNGRNAIRCYRDDCEFRIVTVDQPGPNYRRAIELGGDDCLIYDGEYRSTHHPILNNADGTRIVDTVADSYDGYDAVKLLDGHTGVEIVNSTLDGGILDQGTTNLTIYGNSY
ncbi:hypothetical protein ACFQH6_07670 [Halobacteriaceae archaeon GCM10025711]